MGKRRDDGTSVHWPRRVFNNYTNDGKLTYSEYKTMTDSWNERRRIWNRDHKKDIWSTDKEIARNIIQSQILKSYLEQRGQWNDFVAGKHTVDFHANPNLSILAPAGSSNDTYFVPDNYDIKRAPYEAQAYMQSLQKQYPVGDMQNPDYNGDGEGEGNATADTSYNKDYWDDQAVNAAQQLAMKYDQAELKAGQKSFNTVMMVGGIIIGVVLIGYAAKYAFDEYKGTYVQTMQGMRPGMPVGIPPMTSNMPIPNVYQ